MADIYVSTEASDVEYGLVEEDDIILTGFSSSYKFKKGELTGATNDVDAISVSGKTCEIKLEGYSNGSPDMAIGRLLAMANSVNKFGFTAGTILIDSVEEKSAQGEFKKISVSATAYEKTMTLRE